MEYLVVGVLVCGLAFMFVRSMRYRDKFDKLSISHKSLIKMWDNEVVNNKKLKEELENIGCEHAWLLGRLSAVDRRLYDMEFNGVLVQDAMDRQPVSEMSYKGYCHHLYDEELARKQMKKAMEDFIITGKAKYPLTPDKCFKIKNPRQKGMSGYVGKTVPLIKFGPDVKGEGFEKIWNDALPKRKLHWDKVSVGYRDGGFKYYVGDVEVCKEEYEHTLSTGIIQGRTAWSQQYVDAAKNKADSSSKLSLHNIDRYGNIETIVGEKIKPIKVNIHKGNEDTPGGCFKVGAKYRDNDGAEWYLSNIDIDFTKLTFVPINPDTGKKHINGMVIPHWRAIQMGMVCYEDIVSEGVNPTDHEQVK